ncbi:AsmA-like C-terminal region-containing protein [Algoriphagus algorifonticola]|uniref:AsmA-like C-terminal region-containing protein n=1 Tax=Algoriphagus algorifonticola TaxID=2593007 RepID=UPI0011A11162|nr:AsmA-like C-terminal region-containing protein [Algoriphagus algorifonticola]
MKKAIYILLAIFSFLILSAVAIPIIFKDKIVAKINQELDESINATVYYNPQKISLSIFRSFPDVSAGLGDFGIIGKDQFEGDTLIQVDQLDLDFNLKSVLFGDYPMLTGLHLNGGDLYIKVLEDGTANYDITKSSDSESESSESNFRIGIEQIEVNHVNMIYDDRSLQFTMALADIMARGSGDFTLDVYDLPVKATATIADMAYEGTHYLTNKKFQGDANVQVDLENMKFSFENGKFGLNDFLFNMNGFIALPEEGVDYDLAFAAPDSDFKSVLSLVPGMYTESFSSIKSSGTMSFEGFVKGLYTETSIPSFDINLQIKDGMFQYPELPKPVDKINVNMAVKNETSQLENTSILIPTFSLNFGSNPISGNFTLQNLKDYLMEGELNGKLNLKELTSIFPIEGTSLAGNLDFSARAKGRYDSTNKVLPAIAAQFKFSEGYVKNAEYPAALEKIHAVASIRNDKGSMQDFVADFSSFGFELEGEKIEGNLRIADFEALNWKGAVAGAVDLEKIIAIFPIADIELKGKIQANINSTGSYQDVEKEQFSRINTSGDLTVSRFFFKSKDYPQGVAINQAKANFNPQRAELVEFDSKLGKSPLTASGFLSNYMDYLLSENGTLKGQLSLNSSYFDINEWMSESSSSSTDSSKLEVIALPKNIDFTMAVRADEVIYDNLNLKEVRGTMVLREGVLSFNEAGMKTLDGRITLNGNYDPRDIANPKFDMSLDISELSIAKAFQSLTTVKAFAPIAKDITGRFNTKLNFSGLLGPDMMPVLSSLDVSGILAIAEAALKENKILEGLTSLTKLKDANTIQLRNIKVPISIENGMMEVKPFDVKLWDYQTTVQGTAGFDGSINYLLNMQVPAGKFGAQANSILASISGSQANESTLIPLSINLAGSYNQPKVSLAGGNSIETLLANALRSRFDSEKQNFQNQAQEQFQAAQDSIKNQLKIKADIVQDSVKKELQKKTGESAEKVVQEAKSILKGVLKGTPKPTKPDTTSTKN